MCIDELEDWRKSQSTPMTPQKETKREPRKELIVMIPQEHGSDPCFCGDYLSQHKPRCFCGCKKFIFTRKANEVELAHWQKYHGNRCFSGLPGCDCYGTFEILKELSHEQLTRWQRGYGRLLRNGCMPFINGAACRLDSCRLRYPACKKKSQD